MSKYSKKAKERFVFTKVKKKGNERKRENMEKVRELIDKYNYCYVFNVNNFRNTLMKDIKNYWKTSTFFQGKVKPTIITLGTSKNNEYRSNLSYLSKCLNKKAKGSHKGLMFTNTEPKIVLNYFKNNIYKTYPKNGFVSTKNYIINKGYLNNFVFSQEYQLRMLGLPVQLINGKIYLNSNYNIAKKGQPLNSKQCKLLELLDEKIAEFKFTFYGYWTHEQYFDIINDDINDDNDDMESKMDDDSDVILNNDGNNNENSIEIDDIKGFCEDE